MKILGESLNLLSFRDRCKAKPVCRSWVKIIAFPHCVQFFEDGSEFDLPDSDDVNFRKCILDANITNLHCQVFNQDQLDFVLKILPSLKVLTMEIHGTEEPINWGPQTLSLATKVRKIILDVADFEEEIKIDFKVLKFLNHLETNASITIENYDGREMKYFEALFDDFDETYAQICSNSIEASGMGDHPSERFIQYLSTWVKDPSRTMKPYLGHIAVNFMRFATISRQGLKIASGNPVGSFLENYATAFTTFLNEWPDIPLEFEDGCSIEERQKWFDLINPIRSKFGLPPCKAEN